LNHPNIAQVYGLQEFEGTYCIAMELIRGETLADRLRRGPLAPSQAVRIGRDIADVRFY
jgi:serine/threonine protein kinase